jgi:hypothetical protein
LFPRLVFRVWMCQSLLFLLVVGFYFDSYGCVFPVGWFRVAGDSAMQNDWPPFI